MIFREITDAYRSSAQWQKLSDNTLKLYSSYINRLVEAGANLPVDSDGILKVFGETHMQLPVAVAHYVALWQRIVDSFDGNHAKNMARRVLLNVFSWAKSYGFPVVSAIENLEAPRLNKGFDKFPFTQAEVTLLRSLLCKEDFLGAYKPYIRAAVVAFHSGMRPSEVEGLMWQDVTETHILIRSAKWKEKGEVSRGCKITPEIKEMLPERRSPNDLVFCSVSGRPLNKDMRSRAIHYACSQAGIPEREFYCTRRGTATTMFQSGYNLIDIQNQLGHESLETTRIYIQMSMLESANRFKGVTNNG